MGYTPDDTELAFVRKAWDDCSAFLTICGGILVPLQAGILEDKTATAPAFMVDDVRKQAPGTNWVTKRWVRDGKLWTSGALLNGTDMMTNFVKSYWGKGDDSLVGFLCKLGAWPDRDIDYKDVV
jgi:transcriptional regulator GlxA family with amidase domain